MRLIKFLTILAIAMLSSMFVCHAQYDNYYKADNTATVMTNPKAELYLLPEAYRAAVASGEAFSFGLRDVVDIAGVKPKRVNKPQQLRVLRYTNTAKQQSFDAYIVEYKDDLWVVKSSDVEDNILLEQQNTKIVQHGQMLECSRSDIIKRREALNESRTLLNSQIDTLAKYYAQICTDSLTYYRELGERLPEIRDSLVEAAEREEQARVDKLYNKWYSSLPATAKAAAKAITIEDSTLDYPNSVGGCDYYLKYTNNSSKTIKYLYWTGITYNAVDDPVSCEIRRTSTFSGKNTGPIASGESGGGYWDCIVYNYSADYMRLTQIRIIYMDGSSINIGAADIARLFNEPSREVSVDTWAIRQSVMSDWACSNKITLWRDRLNSVQDRVLYSGEWDELKGSHYNSILSSLSDLDVQERDMQAEIDSCQRDIDTFSKFVNFEKFAHDNKQSTPYRSSSYSGGASKASVESKSPFVTFGIEGSLEGLKSFSAGFGLAMRIGRYSSLFNATIGVKYQHTAYSTSVSYSYSEDYAYYHSYAKYKREVGQVVIPAVLNWNIARADIFSFYMGVGYEYGVMTSGKQDFEYDFGSIFNEEDFYKYGDDIVQLSVPARSAIIQIGLAGRDYDWKVYYKIHQPNSMLTNHERGAIGTAFMYYF